MRRYVLDTNIISDLVRNPTGQVAQRIARVGEQSVCTSIMVAAELRNGSAKKGSTRLSAQLEAILESLEVLPLGPPVDRVYVDLWLKLEKKGRVIGGNDLLIAAHTLALGYAFVTDNEREFSGIDSLRVENWLR